MGLLTRLRSHERSKSQDSRPASDVAQTLHSASSSGISDFLLVSLLSRSSTDKPRTLDPLLKELLVRRLHNQRRILPQHRYSWQMGSSSPQLPLPSVGKPINADANSTQHASNLRYPPSSQQPLAHNGHDSNQGGGHSASHRASRSAGHSAGRSAGHSAGHEAAPNARQTAYDGYYAYSGRGPNETHRPVPHSSLARPSGKTLGQRAASGLSSSLFEASSADVSGVSGNSGSSSEYEDDPEAPEASHPYYKQWKEYYEALEKQKLDPSAVVAQLAAKGAAQQPQAKPQAQLKISPEFLNQAKSRTLDNLVLNSRKSTIKSNRSASVPASGHVPAVSHSRAVSTNESFAAGAINSSSSGTDLSLSMCPNTADSYLSVNTSAKKLLVRGGGGTSRHPPTRDAESVFRLSEPSNSVINSYGASERTNETAPFTKGQSASSRHEHTVSSSNGGVVPSKDPATLEREQYNLHLMDTLRGTNDRNALPRRDASQISDYAAYIFEDDDDDFRKDTSRTESGTVSQTDISRQNSAASASSYNSLQSEKQFSVGRNPSRIATPSQNAIPGKGKSSFSPPLVGPPPPIYPNMYNSAHQLTSSFADFNRHSMIGLPMNNAYMQQMQQQIIQQMLQMQHLNNPQYQGAYPPSPQAACSSDARINSRIQEFIELRQAIASGNKSLEFRLEWLKMLVCAVNYKLFSYINIRGEPIPQEQISPNKQFFIKSVQNHLQKLMRELNSDRLKNKGKVFGEMCYIQGCLYLQSYLERYYQDFGYDRDDEEAERFFKLAIEYDPMCFKAIYELGELYESQEMEDSFDLALENYKESAKLGYNRAIYKVALIYLVVPKVRLTKFYRYFKNLADIDMESHDVQLSGIDLEELQQVVGLAQFQLGKLYEGIYPGDLTIEDQFVVESLELAPVNYAKSLAYYNRAAKLSCVQAQVKLGHVYEQGELNRPYNAVKSIQWYIKAATSPLKFMRHPEAMLGISRWFMRGTDGESKHIPYEDEQMAIQWCERACKEFGSAEALYQMGLYVEDGLVMGDAKLYFREAADLGHGLAMQKYEEL